MSVERSEVFACALLFLALSAAQVFAGSHTAQSDAFTLDTRDVVRVLKKDMHESVVAGTFAGGAAFPAVTFDTDGKTAAYVILRVDPESTTPAVQAGGRDFPFWSVKNLWRVDTVSGHTAPTLDTLTQVRVWVIDEFGGSWSDGAYDWGVDRWRAAKYTWEAYDAEGQALTSGMFSLAVATPAAGKDKTAVPVLLLHGIGSSRDLWLENGTGNDTPCGALGQDRPVYTLDYPNIGDIPKSGQLLGMALEEICAAHGVEQAHVIAHSMGGVITRYYRQNVVTSRLQRFFSFGSPFEGSGFAEGGASEAPVASLKLAVLASVGQMFGVAALGTLDSTALNQLRYPPETVMLANNDDQRVRTDDWLSACGTKMGLVFGQDVLNLLMASGDRVLDFRQWGSDILNAHEGSDGVVSWSSANWRPLSSKTNLYYKANHTDYFSGKTDDYEQMLADMRSFLADGKTNLALRDRPLFVPERVAVRAVSAGRAVQSFACTVKDDMVTMLPSVLSAAGTLVFQNPFLGLFNKGPEYAGNALAAVKAEGSDDDTVYVFAPGYQSSAVGYKDAAGELVVTASEVELVPEPAWTKPRGCSCVINGGAPATSSATVQIALFAENAAEAAVYEPGQEPVWEAYAGGEVQRTFTFASETPGEKTVLAAFRNADGEGPAAVGKIALVEEAQSGSLEITDDLGQAVVLINGESTIYQTPALIPSLPVGAVSILLVKTGFAFTDNPRTVEVAAGQQTPVHFDVVVAPAPAFAPDGGAYPGPNVEVTVSHGEEGAVIRYTLDGTEPTESSLLAASGAKITVPVPGVLSAKAWVPGMTPSAVKTATYTLGGNVTGYTYNGFLYRLTDNAYPDTSVLAGILADYGAGAELADWNEIKQAFSQDIYAFMDAIGLVEYDQCAFVLRGGEGYYDGGDRHYFVSRHNGEIPSYYLAHDQIQSGAMSLGSWATTTRALIKLPLGTPDEPGPVVGVAWSMGLPGAFAGASKVSVKGLPAGLKYNSKTGKIEGVPTRAGMFSVTISAAGVSAQTLTVIVEALPPWAQGSYAGYFDEGGLATFSVAANGKVSGKLSLAGTNYTFTAASYGAGGNAVGGFSLQTTAKAGKTAKGVVLNVLPDSSAQAPVASAATLTLGSGAASSQATLWQQIWKSNPDRAAPYAGYYTATLPGEESFGSGYLTFTVGKAGAVKTAGKLADGTPVSQSGTLLLDGDGRVFTAVYATPKTYKGGSLFGVVSFDEPLTGPGYSLSALDAVPFIWQNRNAAATATYGDGFDRLPGLIGGWYSKTDSLYGYYAGKTFTVEISDSAAAPVLTVGSLPVESAWWDPSGVVLATTFSSGGGLTGLSAPAAGKPTDSDQNGVWDYGAANSVGLKVALKPATGIFKGSFLAWFDYPVNKHVSKSVAFEGVLTPVREDPSDGVAGRGYFLWPEKAVPPAPAKPYTFNWSYDFLLLETLP